MPTAIIDDSFSRDLLYLFDKKRSKIHYELGFTDTEPSPEPSLVSIPPSVHGEIPHVSIVERKTPRRRAASDLLRRSSAYFKAKLNHFKHKSQDHLQQAPDPFAHVERSTLKEYPPKPLVYSPIEPIPTEEQDLLHKISKRASQYPDDTVIANIQEKENSNESDETENDSGISANQNVKTEHEDNAIQNNGIDVEGHPLKSLMKIRSLIYRINFTSFIILCNMENENQTTVLFAQVALRRKRQRNNELYALINELIEEEEKEEKT